MTQNFDHGHRFGYHEEVEIVKGGMTVERLEGTERLGKHLQQTSMVSKYEYVYKGKHLHHTYKGKYKYIGKHLHTTNITDVKI